MDMGTQGRERDANTIKVYKYSSEYVICVEYTLVSIFFVDRGSRISWGVDSVFGLYGGAALCSRCG